MATVARNGRAPRVHAAPEPPASMRPEGSQLAAAVLAVQAAAPALLPNATGNVGGRAYRYVDLAAVVQAVLPLLVEHELLWRGAPAVNEHGQPTLRYTMTHVPSGESEEGEMVLLLAKSDMQALGSAITYARRYALCAYLNLTVDADDDGAAAGQPTPPSRSAPQLSATPAGSERACSAAQRKMLYAKAKAAKLSAGQLANALKSTWGDAPVEWADEDAAKRFVDRALDRLPARLVDAAVKAIETEEVPF